MTNNTQNNNAAVYKAKKSLMRSQMRAIIILVAAVVVLSVVLGVVLHIVRRDIDAYYEREYKLGGNDTVYTYFSRKDGDLYTMVYEDGTPMPSFVQDEVTYYETRLGTLLTLGKEGKIKVYAVVDVESELGEQATTNSTLLLLFPRIERSEIKSLKVVNDKGGYSIYAVDEDTNGDGKKEHNFYIEGFKSAPINKITLAAIVTRCGIVTASKLNYDEMVAEDKKHEGEEGYIPTVNPDGSINYSVYGLAETYEVIDEETGEKIEKTTPHYLLTDTSGNTHKVIIGNLTPDGDQYYLRYIDAEGNARRPVYLVAKDPSAGTGYSSDVATTMLASAAEIVAPSVLMNFTESTYHDVQDFTISQNVGGVYKPVISFTYDELEERINTVRQDLVFHLEMVEELGLTGYELDSDRALGALQALKDISVAGLETATGTTKNYINTVALITAKINDLSKITEESFKDPEILESALLLQKYGLFNAKYILRFNCPLKSGVADSPSISQSLFISEKTNDNTYYVWVPLYSQIVEIGAQYLDFISWDTFDWVDRKMFHTMITFCDGIRVKAEGFDAVFKLYQDRIISTKQMFSSVSQNYYTSTITLKADGSRHIKISVNLPYTVMYTDGSTGTKTHTAMILSLNLDTVKNYCRMQLGESLSGLTQEELAAIERYSQSISGEPAVADGKVTVSNVAAANGDDYGYVESSKYIITFVYENGDISLSVKKSGTTTSRTLYDGKVFSDYLATYISDGDIPASLTSAEKEEVAKFFLTIQRVIVEKNRATLELNGAEPKDIPIEDFERVYEIMLTTSFYGRADKSDIAGGVILSEKDMADLIAKGDDCDMKIEFHRSVGTDLVFRMYDYSATKSFTTINDSGCFYINKITKNKLLSIAKEISGVN